MSEYLNPFDIPPYPNSITVGFGPEQSLHCEILINGEIQFFDDPLGDPVLTLKPKDWETVKFMASHLEHYWVTSSEREEEEEEEEGEIETPPSLVTHAKGKAARMDKKPSQGELSPGLTEWASK